MCPELFRIPFTSITVKAYGTMMVIGFLLAITLMRHCARRIRHNPEYVTNAALYALLSGVFGARVFYIFHNLDSYRENLWAVFQVWNGGLELVGGVLFAICVLVFILKKNKLPVRTYLDLLAIGLMIGISIGRIGCYLNGCCFGKPTESKCAIHFPYGSPSYINQAYPNPPRDRYEPQIDLPAEFFGYLAEDGKTWIPATESNKYMMMLKPYELLTERQKQLVHEEYHHLPVIPTQFISSFDAFIICLILYLFWRNRGIKYQGATFALMFILYGPNRFFIETLRDDNPFEHQWWTLYKGGTISQNIFIYMFILGLILMFAFSRVKSLPPQPKE